MELSIQERLKDLRVERGLTLEQLAEKTHLSKSALGSYEGDNLKDISHYALIELAKFYEVTVDYLLGRSQTRNHPNADLADLRLSDDMIELLKSGRVDNSLLCELAAHPDFPRLMADLEIYVNGVAGKQVQSANAIVDAVSATIMKQHNKGFLPRRRKLRIVRFTASGKTHSLRCSSSPHKAMRLCGGPDNSGVFRRWHAPRNFGTTCPEVRLLAVLPHPGYSFSDGHSVFKVLSIDELP